MRLLVLILALLLLMFGGGCAILMTPFIQNAGGRSALNDPAVWGPILFTLVVPMIASGGATLWILWRTRGPNRQTNSFSWLIVLDVVGGLLVFGWLTFVSMLHGFSFGEAIVPGAVALVLLIKAAIERQLARIET